MAATAMVTAAASALWVCTPGALAAAAKTPAPPPLPGGAASAPDAAPAAFGERWRRDGLMLLRLPPSQHSLQEALRLVDGLMRSLGLIRNNMTVPELNGTSLNPRNFSFATSPRRIAFVDNHFLAPADGTAQGPHQEGMHHTRNNRQAIAFFCEEPSDRDGDTALFDMQRAWQLLPPHLQERLRAADFGYQNYDGGLSRVPCVVNHDVSGAPCLQFYCFGKLTRDCVDVYRETTGRYHVRPEPYTYLMDKEADLLLLPNGTTEKTPFIGLALYQMLSSVYGAMFSHHWERGDVLVVDNVRWAHARLEGSGMKRAIRFFTYGPEDRSFDLNHLGRP